METEATHSGLALLRELIPDRDMRHGYVRLACEAGSRSRRAIAFLTEATRESHENGSRRELTLAEASKVAAFVDSI